MSRSLQMLGLVLTGLIAILFIADLAAGVPFRRVSVTLDVGMAVASFIVGYLIWSLTGRGR